MMGENARVNVPAELPGDIRFAQTAQFCLHRPRSARASRRGTRAPLGGFRCWSGPPDWLADPCDLETWLITYHAQTAQQSVAAGVGPVCGGTGADGI